MKSAKPFSLLVLSLCFYFTARSQNIIATETAFNPSVLRPVANAPDPFEPMDPPYYIEAGQVFRSLLTTTISTIQFNVRSVNSSGSVDLAIYSCPSSNSWGTLLNTKTNIPVNSTGLVVVDISDLAIPVTAGNYYGFKLIAQFGAYIFVAVNDNLYPDGEGWSGAGAGFFTPTRDVSFEVLSASVVPVRMTSFTAQKQNNNILLKWSTASEQNAKDFIVQHSVNGADWNDIGTVAAAGNSASIRSYSYLHTTCANGMNYYRLRQTDVDGSSTISKVSVVNLKMDLPLFQLLANPVTDGSLRLRVTVPAVLSFYNSSGALIWKKQFAPGLQQVNVSTCPKGLYFLQSGGFAGRVIVQ